MGPAQPQAYDEYFKAYSVAMLPGRERENVSYGGKIIMPPSSLASLTNLDLPSPWMFKLRNPSNPAASTHAGVLEFIAEEGCVHLPHWMMRTLRLEEGDPIRITGAELSKGTFVKFQAQSVHFLEISDPKAVLEHAMRNYTALTQGDIVEISYNSIVFGLLVMEASPGGEGVSVLDTDLEVDFAAPVGYVEPERPKPAAPATMASRLKIDVDGTSPGSSRPGSSLAGGFSGAAVAGTSVTKAGDHWESFKGTGESLAGRKTKGKGLSHRQAAEVEEGSKIMRTGKHKIVTNEMLENTGPAPAALNLPFGQLFFGFNVASYTAPTAPTSPDEQPAQCQQTSFGGAGSTLTGRNIPAPAEKKKAETKAEPAKDWGAGQRLAAPTASSSSSRKPSPPQDRSSSPEFDYGVDDDDVIMIDSD
ncbi:ubiquitin fusion degradation protein UFD1-domain-containing protein [Pterulicium gracile]|uniref:Ubiquitin fusion degradation protein UFD1-domain-containing protein n=1 Tax=Pterulicium gracile TaxID=1884261 RepID=A0A5C3R083_9AGAR|nr:ubiquitin fusion degradation protein UFD1-domain-containing protein [Pterula gracilis]